MWREIWPRLLGALLGLLVLGALAVQADEPVNQPDTMDFERELRSLKHREVRALEKIASSLKKMERCR